MNSDKEQNILGALKAEETQAVGYLASTLVADQIEALDRYFGAPYGDEVEGRSRLTTREVFEVVEEVRTDLYDVFAAGGNIAEIKPANSADAQAGQFEQRADFINYVFFVDNNGEELLDNFIFDGLLQRRGFACVEWCDEEYGGPEKYTGLTQLLVEQLIADPNTDILEMQPEEDGMTYTVKARALKKPGYPKITTPAPEDMYVNARTVDMDSARYIGEQVRMMRGEWKKLFPDKADEIDEYSGGAGNDSGAFGAGGDERRAARFRDDDERIGGGPDESTKESEELVGRKEFLRYDWNDDGYPERVRVWRLGDLVLEVEEVDDHPYASWTPLKVPHRFYGLSLHDETGDLQRAATVTRRAAMDAMYQSVVPRLGYDKTKVSVDDVLDVRPGATIAVEGSPGDSIFPVQVPDLTGSALKMGEVLAQSMESRTGVTRHGQGLDPDALTKTARGMQLMQNASARRTRMRARRCGMGVQALVRKVYQCVVRNQKQPREVLMGQAFAQVDPRSWSVDSQIIVDVGLGTGSKETQLMMLQMIQADQVAFVANYGMDTPIVTPQHLHHTVTQKLRVMGYRNAQQFFGTPPADWKPQPPPNPDQQKIQAQIQEAQARMQMDAQKAQADAQLAAQTTQADVAMQTQRDQATVQAMREKAALELQLAREKAEAEMQLAQARAASEMQLRQAQMEFEARLAVQQQEFEMKLAEKKQADDARIAEKRAAMQGAARKSNGRATPSGDANFGGEVG